MTSVSKWYIKREYHGDNNRQKNTRDRVCPRSSSLGIPWADPINHMEIRMHRSDNINELAAALAKARGDFSEIVKSRTVEIKGKTKTGQDYKYEYSYAELSEIHACTIKALSANGLSVTQSTTVDGTNQAYVVTLLMHSSGQWIESQYPIIPKAEDMQGFGAGYTYARRFAINGLLNISSEDDTDGQTVRPQTKSAPMKTQEPQKPQNHAPQSAASVLSEPQIKRLYAIAKELRWDKEDLLTRIKQEYSKDSVSSLSREEYTLLISKMQIEVDRQKPLV
jgi:ERF superfamily